MRLAMPPGKRKSPAPVYVSIVSNNPETLDGLQDYLRGAGIPSHCTRAIRDMATIAPACATATVIFPDDYPDTDVTALLGALRAARPRLLSLLVTRTPQRFRAPTATTEDALPPVVLPKPSFGWDILDVIRAHSQSAR
jgi:hypothetical protein